MVEIRKLPADFHAGIRTKAVAAADAAGVRGQKRDAYIASFMRSAYEGAEEEREKLQRLTEHPLFSSQMEFALGLFLRTWNLESTIAALEADSASAVN